MAASRATTRVGTQFTHTFPIITGVRQGDTVSPLFFNSEIEEVINKMQIRGHIRIKTTQLLAYADDVAIISRNKSSLKEAVINIDN